MTNLLPTQPKTSAVAQTNLGLAHSRQTTKALRTLEERTLLRMANVQAEGFVQSEKLKEIDHLTREAMTGHAMLHQWASTLAHGDVVLADELHYFVGLARVCKGEIITDTLDTYCRESRIR